MGCGKRAFITRDLFYSSNVLRYKLATSISHLYSAWDQSDLLSSKSLQL